MAQAYDPLAEALLQYRKAEQKHRAANPTSDPRLRPHLWMIVFDPVQILANARRAELTHPDSETH